MRPLNFQDYHDDIYTYRFISDEEGTLTKRWSGWKHLDLWIDMEVDDPHWIRFSVSGIRSRIDELALNLGMIWRLSHGLCRYGIPHFFRDRVAKRLGGPYECVSWKYGTEAWSTMQNGKTVIHFEDSGFYHAHSEDPIMPSPSTSETTNQAWLFDLPSFQALADMQKETLNDASSEINLFCLGAGRKEMLLEEWRCEMPPDLSDFLQPGELFIDLLVGIDMGYLDAITVKSPVDISEQIDSLLADFHAAILEYEEQIETIGPTDTAGYAEMLAKLALHPEKIE